MSPLTPLDLPTDLAEHGRHADGFLEPHIGLGFVVLVIVTLVAVYLVLRNRGQLPTFALPGFAPPARPEDAAKQILAERFAHGDLSPEEFMERASALSWTPGVEQVRLGALGRR